MECSARTNLNIREIFKTFLFLSKIVIPGIEIISSSRRTSKDDTFINCNGKTSIQDEKSSNFPRCDSIILTSSNRKLPSPRNRWGSLKSSSSSNTSTCQTGSPLRRNVSAYGRPTKLNKIGETDGRKDRVTKLRIEPNPGNKMNGIHHEELEVHIEQVSHCIY